MSRPLRLDCHTHLLAAGSSRGSLSDPARRSAALRYLRLRKGLFGTDASMTAALQEQLLDLLDEAADVLDGAVVFAFDAVYDESGSRDVARTHYTVENDHIAELSATHRRIFFGASIHPLRRDAIAALERAVAQGAVLLKWLPPTQAINPADPRVFEFYDALAHHGLPLLTHTGVEHTLPVFDHRLGDPALLEHALARNVTVVLAHAGVPMWPWDATFLPTVRALMERFEHCYADTAALGVPTRVATLRRLFADSVVSPRLLHGSDWPLETLPNPFAIGAVASLRSVLERNPFRRDVSMKAQLGAPPEYWTRASAVLRIPSSKRSA